MFFSWTLANTLLTASLNFLQVSTAFFCSGKQIYLIIKIIVMRKQIFFILSLLLLLPFVLSEGQVVATPLSLQQKLQVELAPSTSKEYRISTIAGSSFTQDLFIYAEPRYADPFQVPYLSISSTEGYKQDCYNANAEFAGICRIKSQDLNKHANFFLTVKCLAACSLDLQTELGRVVKLDVGESLQLKGKDNGLTEMIHLVVPDLDFSSLAVMAVLLNQEESIEMGEEGVSVLINYGTDVQDPTQTNFQVRAGSLNGGGKGAFIHKDKISPGQMIKAEIRLKAGIEIRFGVAALSGNEFSIEVGRPYYDYTAKQPKIYSLNASFLTQDKTLEIVFDVYSGNPIFDVSFNHDFKEIIEFTRKSTAASIIISPQVRSKYHFNGTLFIRASSDVTAEYYFYTQLIRNDATFIQPYLTYFDQLPKNKVENYLLFQHYKFPRDTPQQRNFSFKIETITGTGSFYFKRCPSLESQEQPSFGDCLLQNPSQLKQQKFYNDQIQNKHVISGNLLTIFMSYDITQCTHINSDNSSEFVSVVCVFQVIALGQSQSFEFSLLSQRKYLSSYLRQGRIVKQYIPRDSYAYFAFALPDLASVEQVNIFLTTLSGDAALIISTHQKLPDLSSTAIKQSGQKCNIVLSGNSLAKEIYISVYAYQFTEVNLGVIVHRKSTPGSVHEIPLEKGNIQSYILNKTQKYVRFIVVSKSKGEITVVVNELLGAILMKILNEAGKEEKCSNVPQDRLFCKFQADEGKKYSIQISTESQQAKISISYRTNDAQCFSGSLNYPIYISLPAEQRSCYTFNINREVPLLFVSSLTHIQTLEKQIKTSLYLNDALYTSINSTHMLITVHNMIEICEMGIKSDTFPKSCRVSLAFDNSAATSNDFSFILQETDADVALLDGVSEKVREIQAAQNKHFYYHVKSSKILQLFFSSQSLKSHYYLAARFASNEEFLSRNKEGGSIYPAQVQEKDRKIGKIDSRDNFYSALLGLTGLEVISIDQAAIMKYCPALDCYLLVSVFTQSYQSNIATQDDSYEIEVTQEETVLPLGESRIGVVNKGDVYTYLVTPQDAIVQFRMINSASSGKMCLKAQAAISNGTILKGNELSRDLQVSKSDQIQRIFVIGEQDSCSYQVSYVSNDNPYRVVRLSHPYELSIENGKFQRFIYYHQNPRTFKIAPLVSAGSLKAYIMPVKSQNMSLLQLSKLKLSDYPLISNDNGEYTIRENDHNFCSKCFYYVLITTQTKFIGQVVFLRLYDPVPLSANHIFKEHLLPLTALGVQNYIFYSLTSFNITFNMFSGEMQLVITDPFGEVVVSEDVSITKTYSFPSIQYEEKEKIEYYSERAKYKIRVAVIKQAEFYVQVKRALASERLFEGFPSKLSLGKQKMQTVEFVNSQNIDMPLNLMVDIEEEKGDNPALLTFTLRGQTKNGEKLDNSKLMKNITQADNTYILNILNFDGRYFVDIYSYTQVQATFLLVKDKLTHISPNQNYLFNSEGVYQVYSSYNKVLIEVFNCQGELDMIGSRDQRDMARNLTTDHSPIKLSRPNYGGHYVYNVELVFASYFLRVTNKNKEEPLQYVINYYHYEEVNPYEAIDAENYEIQFEYVQEGVSLKVNTPKLVKYKKTGIRDIEFKIQKIEFTAYLALSRTDLNRISRCHIEGNTVEKKGDSSTILVDKSLIDKIGLNNVTKQFYATIQATVSIQASLSNKEVRNNFPQTLTFLYNTVEISVQQTITIIEQQPKKYWFTDSFMLFIGWMALPFVLASASLYYVLTYCMRRLMMRQANMVEEVEIVPSNQTRPTQQKIAESGTVPETGTQMIKEHI